MSTKNVRNVQKGACKTTTGGELSLTSVFVVAVIFLILGIWLPLFYWIGVVLMWVVFLGIIWRLFIRRECDNGTTRISLLGLVIVALVFLLIGIWWPTLYWIGVILVIIALAVFIWRIVIKSR